MNLSKLMITLTLGCLSIVAIAALALLPITDGVCHDAAECCSVNDDDGWRGETNTAKRYYATSNLDNKSWGLSGSVDAKGVSASGSVSILNPDRYLTGNGRVYHHIGNAEVSVKRGNYRWFHNRGLSSCNNKVKRPFGRFAYRYVCQGHDEDEDAKSNVQGNEGYVEGKHTDITLSVVVDEEDRVEVNAVADSGETIKGIDLSAGAYGASVGISWKHNDKNVQTVSITRKYKRRDVYNQAEISSQEVSVSFHEKATSSATASVSFCCASSGSETVTYTP